MKKFICLLVSMLMIVSCACAETVHVSISDGSGKLVLAHRALDVSDTDGDGQTTIYDALVIAHDAAYEGGAQAGFIGLTTEYGISVERLWGEENGGSYGYYVNNTSALSLSDPIQDGDSVYAYVYSDLETWSDTFSHFNKAAVQGTVGEELCLELTMQTFDASWNTVLLPVNGAIITINGEDSTLSTDAEGKAVITFDAAGEYIVSAHSDAATLVPPVCVVEIK